MITDWRERRLQKGNGNERLSLILPFYRSARDDPRITHHRTDAKKKRSPAGTRLAQFWRSPDNRTLTGLSKPHGLRCLVAAAKAATNP